MKERLGNIDLLNRLTGEFEPASIVQGLDEANFRDFETLWKPALDKRAAEFASWEEAADGNVQDAHWDWVGKAKSEAKFEAFGIECAGMTQGLMLVDLATRFARILSQKGLDLCYVELIATAPWNRPKFGEKPKYKGVGRALLATAISKSVELEFKGRLGLHSLPESESWYGPLGFTNCGFDDDKGLLYFELTEEAAVMFMRDEGEE
jgi:hypothetical protein